MIIFLLRPLIFYTDVKIAKITVWTSNVVRCKPPTGGLHLSIVLIKSVPHPTIELFGRRVAKNSAWLATLMTMWKVTFRPFLIIPWHLESVASGAPASQIDLKFS